MSFGKTLKRIRLKHKDSLRGLAKKIDLHFTFIDKVEKGTAPISKNFIENVVAVYPEEREILKKEYLKETLPEIFQKEEAIKIVSNSEVLNLPVYGKASAGRGYLNMDSPDYYMPILRGNFSKKSFCKLHLPIFKYLINKKGESKKPSPSFKTCIIWSN